VELSSFFPDDRRKRNKFAVDMWFSKISVRMFIKYHGNKGAYYVWRIPSVIATQDEAKCVQCAACVARKLLATYHTREMRRHFKKVISSGEKIREGHIQALYCELTDDNSALPANVDVESDVGTSIEAGYDLKDMMSLVETNNNLRAGKYATFLLHLIPSMVTILLQQAKGAMALNYTWERFSIYEVCVIE
jgi:hypothetical protein